MTTAARRVPPFWARAELRFALAAIACALVGLTADLLPVGGTGGPVPRLAQTDPAMLAVTALAAMAIALAREPARLRQRHILAAAIALVAVEAPARALISAGPNPFFGISGNALPGHGIVSPDITMMAALLAATLVAIPRWPRISFATAAMLGGFLVFEMMGSALGLRRFGMGISATALAAFTLLCLAALAAHADAQPVRLLHYRDRPGRIARLLLALSIMLPVAIGFAFEGMTSDLSALMLQAAAMTATAGILIAMSLIIVAQMRTAKQQEIRIRLAESMARHDLLTGVNTRRGVHALLLREKCSPEKRRTRTLILADLDNFKDINDAYGHAVGDRVLRDFAHAFDRRLPKEGILARWGGDEFLAMVPEMAGSAMHDLHRQLMQVLSAIGTELNADVHPTVSMAASTVDWPLSPAAFHGEVARVDDLLYAAKKAGRARLKFSDGQDGALSGTMAWMRRLTDPRGIELGTGAIPGFAEDQSALLGKISDGE